MTNKLLLAPPKINGIKYDSGTELLYFMTAFDPIDFGIEHVTWHQSVRNFNCSA